MNSEPGYMPSGHWQQPAMILGQQWVYPDTQHSANHAHSNGVNHQLPPVFTTSMPFASQLTPTTVTGHQSIYLRGLGMENMRPMQDRDHFHNGHSYPSPTFQHYPGGFATAPHVVHQVKQQPSIAYPYGIQSQFPSGPSVNGYHMDYSHTATPLTPHTQPGPAPHSAAHASFPPSPLSSRRGPPRKPKRSGHAVWVGNIPLGASIEALKDHFSRDATNDIESVFLMSKSNCAFVNYRSKEACEAAVERFNHSLFGSVRLLCRLRRDTQSRSSREEDSTSPTPPIPSSDRTDSVLEPEVDSLSEEIAGLGIQTKTEDPLPPPPPAPAEDRYFVLKSLTKEDLNESLQKGTWETQIHNQGILDSAFRETQRNGKNVYLIFSVNKSGEYFGYARMIASPFDVTSPTSSKISPETYVDGLNVIQTPATSTAPKGQIVDDQARGTLFWEAAKREEIDADKSRPFGIEWQSVRRVTFQRTKGMKNAWNSGKDVKVARDGTELESGIGKRILELFFEDAVVNGATNGRR